ncbi:hypothetical protein HAZT_HAZT009242 [Hyalella azteca]|nr:hypothetical protein HAZT_HAZT009242 [Hyalella azteca]
MPLSSEPPPTSESPVISQSSTIKPHQNTESFTPADCLERPEKTSGVYTIYPSSAAVQVYCDQTTDGGGWTVFLRRQKQEPQLNFSRTFKEYEEGFGSPTGEHWLGLENLHHLTTRKTMEMRAAIIRGYSPVNTSSRYRDFRVDGGDEYTLRVGSYDDKRSSASDALTYHNGMQFSTIDRDRDRNDKKCSGLYGGGGWWYNSCYRVHPTGLYARNRPANEMWSESSTSQFVAWGIFMRGHISQLTLMIRPRS